MVGDRLRNWLRFVEVGDARLTRKSSNVIGESAALLVAEKAPGDAGESKTLLPSRLGNRHRGSRDGAELQMFEWDWSEPRHSGHVALTDSSEVFGPSELSIDQVTRTSLLHWQEHCLECAAPQCYTTCSLYTRRADGNCRRFQYGIRRHSDCSGLFDAGADVRFRRWGKLEARLSGHSVTPGAHRWIDRLDRGACRVARAIGSVEPARSRQAAVRGLASLRRRMLARGPRRTLLEHFDAFVLECHSPDPGTFRLILEVADHERVCFRRSLTIDHGANYHEIPVADLFLPDANPHHAKMLLYPENDAERRLVFSWLDFVRFRESGGSRRRTSVPRAESKPSEKVKCVAWDLDNTLWRGTLIESGENGVQVDPRAVALVKALDGRGVLQTIVSKNNHDEAWQRLRDSGLAEYFLYPAINWGRKSSNLEQISRRLNIGLDTFALIDDSAFERAEVSEALPQVRVYADDEIAKLLEKPEFDLPVTELSTKRRFSYLENIEREHAQSDFGGDYDEFLRSCEMRLHLFVPREPSAIERCLELIQRSNQLNLSTRRYSRSEFEGLLAHEGVLCVALHCRDRFGDYGIVGFGSVDEQSEIPVMLDFVLSCRVAQKRVEHTWFQWVADRERARGCNRLRAIFKRTDKNSALFGVFDETPFEAIRDDGRAQHLELRLDQRVLDHSVMSVESEMSEVG